MKNVEFLGQTIFDKNFEAMNSLKNRVYDYYSLIYIEIFLASLIIFALLGVFISQDYLLSMVLIWVFIVLVALLIGIEFTLNSKISGYVKRKKWDYLIKPDYSILTDMLNAWKDRAVKKVEETHHLTPSGLRAKKFELEEIQKVYLFFEKKISFLQKVKDEIIQKRKELDEE